MSGCGEEDNKTWAEALKLASALTRLAAIPSQISDGNLGSAVKNPDESNGWLDDFT